MTPTAPFRPARAVLAVTHHHYAPGQFVPLLECSYGSYADKANLQRFGLPLHRAVCHNPVERPQDRYHCPVCGGDYCSVHASPADHDCAQMTS